MTDPDVIYLQPECCADPATGRLRCPDNEPQPCPDKVPWTRYQRAEQRWIPCTERMPDEADADPWQQVALVKDPCNQTGHEVPRLVPWWKVDISARGHPRAAWCHTGLSIPPR